MNNIIYPEQNNLIKDSTIKDSIDLCSLQSFANLQNSLSESLTILEAENQLAEILKKYSGGTVANLLFVRNRKFYSVHDLVVKDQDYPLSILNFATQSRNCVIINNTNEKNSFANDTYFKHQSPTSLLCLPIHRNTTCIAIIYLENLSESFSSILLNAFETLGNHTALVIENLRLKAEIQETIKLKTDFLSIASHELKNPLTPISLTAQIIDRLLSKVSLEEPLRQKVDKSLETLHRQVQRMAKLIDELLDAKRYAMNPIQLRVEMIDLETLILSSLETYLEEISNNQIELKLDLQKNILCPLDPMRMRQAIGYFISNAIKYGQNKPIEISTSLTNQGYVQIKIKDHGLGISKQDQDRIFEPFNRAISYVEVSGFGLGLYIGKQILDAHRIEITIESDINHGSTFNLLTTQTTPF